MLGSATIATSGVEPAALELNCPLVAGLASSTLNPPPLLDHAVSSRVLPAASTQSVVPPTPTTFGDDAGQSAPYFDPLSPLAVTKVTPLCPGGVVKNGS